MRASSTALTVSVVLHATLVFGATRYIDQSCPVSGNGTTTTCGANGPFRTLTSAACTGAGGIVEIRGGTYRPTGSSYTQWGLTTACSGTPGNPQIIQNYANESVVIEGTKEHVGTGETWAQVAPGVWQSNSGAAGFYSSVLWPFGAWYMAAPGAAEEYLAVIQHLSTSTGGDGGTHTYTCDGTVPAGRMTYQGSTGRLCVHLRSGASPMTGSSFTTPVVAQNIDLFSSGEVNHLTIRRNPAGGSFTIRRAANYNVGGNSSTGVTIDGLIINGCMNRCISMPLAPVANRVLNSVISQCGQEGIHWQDSGQYLIENNEFTDVGGVVSFPFDNTVLAGFTDGCTGIRFTGGPVSGQAVVRGNYVHDTCGGGAYGNATDVGGRAFDFEYSNQNVLVENNLVLQSPTYGSNGFIAFALDASGGPSVFNNIIIRNNRVIGVDLGVQFNTNRLVVTGSGNMIQNNTFVDYATGGANTRQTQGTWNATVTWTNNIFAKTSGSAPALFNRGAYATVLRPTYGVYYCPGCSGNMISWAGTATNSQTSVTAYDASSKYGPPNLDTTGAPPTLKILTASGVAYNAGLAIAPAFADFEGQARPQGASWDIGADEYVSGGLPAPTLLSVQPLP